MDQCVDISCVKMLGCGMAGWDEVHGRLIVVSTFGVQEFAHSSDGWLAGWIKGEW
jgi:hypothetical protein